MKTVQPNEMNDDLLVKYLLGEATRTEAQSVEQWIAADPANAAHAAAHKRLLEAAQGISERSNVDTDAAWERFRQRAGAAQKQLAPVRRSGWIRVAAVVLLAAGIGILAYQFSGKAPVEQIQFAALQKPVTDTLPDGSVVTLNRAATLTFPDRFEGGRRNVALKGEAFFAVSPDKQKPFVIRVNDVTVTVVGTSFNVRGTGDSTQVIVETGIVQVEHRGQQVLLRPGEQVKVRSADSILVKTTDADALHQYYRTGTFVCDNTPLWRFVDVLNEAYGTKIQIDRPALRELPLTTTFKDASPDEIIEVLRITFGLTVAREQGRIHLR